MKQRKFQKIKYFWLTSTKSRIFPVVGSRLTMSSDAGLLGPNVYKFFNSIFLRSNLDLISKT